MILRIQDRNLTQRDGFPNGRGLALRSTLRKRVSTSKVLKETHKLTLMSVEGWESAQLTKKSPRTNKSTKREKEADDYTP